MMRLQHADVPARALPAALPGFAHINRYWDKQQSLVAAKILPGEYYVTIRDEAVVTVLGSCVSACVRDRVLGIGGMNHFMLPEGADTDPALNNAYNAATRYGTHAMERLINDILKAGGRRAHLEVKIVGGGRILAQHTDVGARNIAFVREYLRNEGLVLAGEDVGEVYPRKVYYFPVTGKVRVKKLRALHNQTILERETRYAGDLRRAPIAGEVELF